MNRTNYLTGVALFLLGAGVAFLSIRTEPVHGADPAKTGWEYRVVDELDLARADNPKLDPDSVKSTSAQTAGLNKLAGDGWEVIGTHSAGRTPYHQYVLKRTKR